VLDLVLSVGGAVVVVAVYRNGRISNNAKNELAEEYAGPAFLVAFQFPPLQVGQHSIFVTLRALAYTVPVTHTVWYPVPELSKYHCQPKYMESGSGRVPGQDLLRPWTDE
jgi:hypothetical protein